MTAAMNSGPCFFPLAFSIARACGIGTGTFFFTTAGGGPPCEAGGGLEGCGAARGAGGGGLLWIGRTPGRLLTFSSTTSALAEGFLAAGACGAGDGSGERERPPPAAKADGARALFPAPAPAPTATVSRTAAVWRAEWPPEGLCWRFKLSSTMLESFFRVAKTPSPFTATASK